MTAGEVKNAGMATSSAVARVAPPRVAAPAATNTVTHSIEDRKLKLDVDTLDTCAPSRPPAIAAKKPLVQNTTVRAAVVLMPRVSTATLLSAVARSSRPSRVARITSMTTTETIEITSTNQ